MKIKLTSNHESVLISNYAAGESARNLAAVFGVSKSAVRIRLKKFHVSMRTRAESMKMKDALARLSMASKKAHQNPETHRKIMSGLQSPLARQHRSESLKVSPKALAARARQRHAAKPNNSERLLHAWLDESGVVYQTEHPLGPYVCDVYVPRLSLVIECDGAWWHRLRQEHDRKRDSYMTERGFSVLRLSSSEIDSGVAKSKTIAFLVGADS